MLTNPKFLFWWLSQKDYEAKMPAQRPPFIPKSIWTQVQSREGRPGRCRLWVPDDIEYKEMPPNDWDKFYILLNGQDVGGIVIHSEHATECGRLCGIITDEFLNVVKV